MLACGGLRRHISAMPIVELSGDERATLAAFPRDSISAERFPMSPRWWPIKGALEQLDP